MDATYLIAHAGSEELFNVCKGAINKYTPGDILVAGRDKFNNWSGAFRWLFDNCPTDIGVFIDDDAILLNDITPLIDKVRSNEYSMVGFTSRGDTKHSEYQYFQPNFMIMNIHKFRIEFGINGIDVDAEQAKKELNITTAPEFCYGISQKLRGRKNLDLSSRLSKYYWPASIIADDNTKYVIHLWYGAWKHRRSPEGDMSKRDNEVIEDFRGNKLKIQYHE